MSMKQWVVEFIRTEFFEVHVTAESPEHAIGRAQVLVRKNPGDYSVGTDGIRLDGIEQDEFEVGE